jgi:selT/selW/selH-like putative selenoprotein
LPQNKCIVSVPFVKIFVDASPLDETFRVRFDAAAQRRWRRVVGLRTFGAERSVKMAEVTVGVQVIADTLSTFGNDLGEVSLQPGTGGVFVITYDGEVIWERKTDGGFPDVKQLKQVILHKYAD